jgi:hypothetical protein
MISDEKQGLIVRKLVILVGSIPRIITVNRGWGGNGGVSYLSIIFWRRHTRGSVKNFCQKVQTSNHRNTLLKTANSSPRPIAADECSIIKTFISGQKWLGTAFCHEFKKIAPAELTELVKFPRRPLAGPWLLFLGGRVNHVAAISRDFLKIIPCRDMF